MKIILDRLAALKFAEPCLKEQVALETDRAEYFDRQTDMPVEDILSAFSMLNENAARLESIQAEITARQSENDRQ